MDEICDLNFLMRFFNILRCSFCGTRDLFTEKRISVIPLPIYCSERDSHRSKGSPQSSKLHNTSCLFHCSGFLLAESLIICIFSVIVRLFLTVTGDPTDCESFLLEFFSFFCSKISLFKLFN